MNVMATTIAYTLVSSILWIVLGLLLAASDNLSFSLDIKDPMSQ